MACCTMVYETVIRVDEENALKIYDDSTFAATSTDNVHDYVCIQHFGSPTDNDFTERIGLRLDCVDSTSTSCLLVAEGVGARTSDTSFVLIGRRIHVAIGYFVAAIELADWSLAWLVELQTGACFGIHYAEQHDCVFAIGDMDVTRISMNGMICWSEVVAEAMTDTFDCSGDLVKVKDFDGVLHRLNASTGARIASDHKE